ncbi:MAG: carbohydrate binding domain-containing protein [Saprospiraceae bacterium]|nr:carbohydrate binding domain-containing protein [Saprospiraceae bacterium]
MNDENPNWKEEVVWHLDEAIEWAKKHNKKVLLSEWGTRMYNNKADMKIYFQYMVEEMAKREIDWMYYCGVFNNAWPFALYSSEKGWDESAELVEALTGIYPTMVPPTSQINNSEFDMDIDHWYATEQVTIGTADGAGVNGSRAMRCMVAFVKPDVPSVWQQSPPNWKWRQKGGMLQLRQGNTYTISFYAKAGVNQTTLRVQLGSAPDNDDIFWTSQGVDINTTLTKYEFTYTHTEATAEDVRFSFLFTERHSEIILDDVKVRGARPIVEQPESGLGNSNTGGN